jgi:4-phytase / acid phosphatase
LGPNRSRARSIALCAAALVASAAALPAALAPADAPRLLYVVIFARHGVRSPTWTSDRLRQWSAEDWPSFGVAPGELTPHGRDAVTTIGAYFRQWLAHEALIHDGCSDAARVFIHADVDQRTLESGRALSEALLPNCAVPVHDAGSQDPLFNPMGSDRVHVDPVSIADDARKRLGTEASQARLRDLRPAFDALQAVLTAAGHAEHTLGEQGWDVDVSASATGLDVSGPLATASTLAENLLLEFTNGFNGHDLGWGRLDEPTLLKILPLHAAYADFARRAPGIARARGSNLLAHIAAGIEQAATGRPVAGAIDPPGTSLLLVVGHDTNQSNLSGLLDLSWRLVSYPPDETPPGGALIFTLWRDPASPGPLVRLRYVAQTPSEMRDLTSFTLARPPASADVVIPACASDAVAGACPWPAFSRIVQHAIDPAAVLK